MLNKLLSDQVSEKEITIIQRQLDQALTATSSGDVLEFGCFVGTTSVFLADKLRDSQRQLYLYDSFAGLPEKTLEDLSPAGEQFRPGELFAPKKQLIKNLKQAGVPLPVIKKAWFNQLEVDDLPESVAFAFLDGDYYASIKDPLKLISKKLVPGAIVVVDDYANLALPGAAKAVDEWLRSHPAKLRVEESLAIISDIS